MPRRLLKIVRSIMIFVLILFVCLEGACLIYLHFINTSLQRPTYSFVNAKSTFWRNVDTSFGVWHEPNATYLHHKQCFLVRYQANEYGMRDVNRSLKSSKPRAVVLGDSFAEGFGLELQERFSNILEQKLDREFLNFATAGGFGTVQEWLQYIELVKQFEHKVILWQILPFNDFNDNNRTRSDYRLPYLQGSYPNYTLAYTQASVRPPASGLGVAWDSIKDTVREWSALYQVVRYVSSYFSVPQWMRVPIDNGKTVSMYYDATEPEWLIMRYSIEQVVKEADERQLIIFTIPCYADFLRYDGKPAPLQEKFQQLSLELGFTYVDLLSAMHERNEDWAQYFFTCDYHWNAYANQVAAEILLPYIESAFNGQ
jgi:hypothetical protein